MHECCGRRKEGHAAGTNQRLARSPTPGSARTGSGATKAAPSGGGSTVWSSGLCRPLTGGGTGDGRKAKGSIERGASSSAPGLQ